MAKELLTWDEIAQKDEFKALDKAEREKLRNTYFSRAIASRTPTEQLEAARKQFDKDTKPTLLKSIKGAVGDVVERITPDPRDEQPAAAAPAGPARNDHAGRRAARTRLGRRHRQRRLRHGGNDDRRCGAEDP